MIEQRKVTLTTVFFSIILILLEKIINTLCDILFLWGSRLF